MNPIRGRVIVVALATCLLFAVVAGTVAEAGPAPTSTIVLNCSRNVTYTYWPEQAPAIAVYYYNSAGVIQDASYFIYCKNGGGRARFKLNLTEAWPQISVACFRYTGQGPDYFGYEIGETDFMPLPASGTCTDDGQSGQPNLGTFASWSVR